MRYTMNPQSFEYSHSVTTPHTVPHWVLYTMDAIESRSPQTNREQGCDAVAVYDFASDESGDSIVFRNEYEIRNAMEKLATDRDALQRRTNETEWDGADVDWKYRLSDHGRKALLDMGAPEFRPNRRDPEFDRELPVEPTHEPGWWRDETEDSGIDSAWETARDAWVRDTEYQTLFYRTRGEADIAHERGYDRMARDLADAFPEVTFVLTTGPYRPHDISYNVRDIDARVVQFDVYSPLAMHRDIESIRENMSELVHDLHDALMMDGDA